MHELRGRLCPYARQPYRLSKPSHLRSPLRRTGPLRPDRGTAWTVRSPEVPGHKMRACFLRESRRAWDWPRRCLMIRVSFSLTSRPRRWTLRRRKTSGQQSANSPPRDGRCALDFAQYVRGRGRLRSRALSFARKDLASRAIRRPLPGEHGKESLEELFISVAREGSPETG